MDTNISCDEIREFLLLARPDGLQNLTAIDPSSGSVSGYTFSMPNEAGAASEWAQHENDSGKNVYWSVNPVWHRVNTKPSKEDIGECEYSHADIDPDVITNGYEAGRLAILDERFSALFVNGHPPAFVIDSGNGIAAYFPVSGVPNHEAGEVLNKRVVQKFGADPGTWNIDRIMRLPGTKNYPTKSKLAKGYPSEPTTAKMLYTSDARYTYEELDAALPECAEESKSGNSFKSVTISSFNEDDSQLSEAESNALADRFKVDREGYPKLQQRWSGNTDGLQDASRSGRDMSLVSILKGLGYTFRETREILRHFKHGAGEEKYNARDQRYFQRMWMKAAGKRPKRKRPGSVQVEDFTMSTLAAAFIQNIYASETTTYYQGEYHSYDGSGYTPVPDENVRHDAWDFLPGCYTVGDKGEKNYFSKTNIQNVRNVFEGGAAILNPRVVQTAPYWIYESESGPPADEIITFPNGLLHLPSGEFIQPTPGFFTLNVLPYEFDPDAPAPKRWLKFLDEVLPGDRDSQETLQEIFGYILLPDTRYQKFFFLIGKKRGGKGTVARVLSAMIGQHNVAGTTLNSLAGTFGLESLPGKLLWLVTDMRMVRNSEQHIILERILSITGEDIISADRKYRQPWTGRILARLLVMSNQPPKINDPSGALLARMVPIVFTQTFEGKEDPGLESDLLSELPGILNWSLEGYKRLQARGRFLVPESAKEMLGHIERSTDPLAEFLDEYCRIGTDEWCTCDGLFTVWNDYRRVNGIQAYNSKRALADLLRERFPDLVRRQKTKGEDRVWCYFGLSSKMKT